MLHDHLWATWVFSLFLWKHKLQIFCVTTRICSSSSMIILNLMAAACFELVGSGITKVWESCETLQNLTGTIHARWDGLVTGDAQLFTIKDGLGSTCQKHIWIKDISTQAWQDFVTNGNHRLFADDCILFPIIYVNYLYTLHIFWSPNYGKVVVFGLCDLTV